MVYSNLKSFLIKGLGLNDAVVYSIANKSWALISGLVTIWLITTYFSPTLQGFHFTFASILVFQNLMELGFGIVLIQFVSHEWSNLNIEKNHEITGKNESVFRLASAVRLGLKWYCVLSILFFFIIGTLGYLFISLKSVKGISIGTPWWILVGTVSLSLIFFPLRCLLEGSDQVGRSQNYILRANLISGTIGWLAIYLGADLYSISIITGTKALVDGFFLLSATRPFLRLFKYTSEEHFISWKDEFWPQQWRIGTSWFSGFFMFQSFVPIIFYLKGPIEAGIAGTTFQIFNSVNSVAYAWVGAVAPKMGILYAKNAITKLKALIRGTRFRSFFAAIFCSIGAVGIIIFLNYYNFPQAKRFADPVTISALLFTVCLLQISNVETAAVRFQKKEPFVFNSIVSALMVLASNVTLGYFFGLRGTIWGFTTIFSLITLPWIHMIYKKNYKELSLFSETYNDSPALSTP